jgi:guanylate kinase
MNPIKAFAKDYFKGEKYTLALGIRVDEIDRINPKRKELGIIYPLAQSEYKPMTKKQVNFFWEMQPFRLELKGYEGNCITCYKKSNNKLYQIAQENPEAFEFFAKMEEKYGNVNGKIPQKIWEEFLADDGVTVYEASRLETLPKEEYKNTIFRNFKTARDILEESKNFDKTIIDDHIETESCEIFSNCGEGY